LVNLTDILYKVDFGDNPDRIAAVRAGNAGCARTHGGARVGYALEHDAAVYTRFARPTDSAEKEIQRDASAVNILGSE
jgi:hypothetical protein